MFDLIKVSRTDSYFSSAVDVCAKPDWFVGARAGFCPPGLPGNDGLTGGNACFIRFHVAENFDGIFCASLVWIQPVLPCVKNKKTRLQMFYKKIRRKGGMGGATNRFSSRGSTVWCRDKFWQGSPCFRLDCAWLVGFRSEPSRWPWCPCLRSELPGFCWAEPHLCWTLATQEDQPPDHILRSRLILDQQGSPRSRLSD